MAKMSAMDTTLARQRPIVTWSDAARRELPAKSRGRSLVVDYFASRCCGSNLTIGDLTVRWSAGPGSAGSEFVHGTGREGIDLAVHRDLVAILDLAGATIVMRGWGRLRRPAVVLADGAAWLEFIGSRSPRSPFRNLLPER
jgi:hypothetical protein